MVRKMCGVEMNKQSSQKKKKKVGFYVFFPMIYRLRHAGLLYVYHYTLAVESENDGYGGVRENVGWNAKTNGIR